jgi:hypothetical protein
MSLKGIFFFPFNLCPLRRYFKMQKNKNNPKISDIRSDYTLFSITAKIEIQLFTFKFVTIPKIKYERKKSDMRKT